jgi:hypothetical protein
MRGGEAFEEVLDQQIQGLEADRRVTFTASRCSTATAYGFFFTVTHAFEVAPSAPRTIAPSHPGTIASASAAARLRRDRPSHPPSPLRGFGEINSRSLSTRERHALHDLIELGAALHEGFTRRELRSAFRVLARRYHPDRHSTSGADEKARLATIFSRVYDSYQVLARI